MKLVTRNNRRASSVCSHHDTISVTHAGLERIICNDCSDLRLVYRSQGVSTDPERGSFAREFDQVAGR